MKWQPIATAPKSTSKDVPPYGKEVTGVFIIGFIPEDLDYEVDPQSLMDVIWWEPNLGDGGVWTDGRNENLKPTHWHPLPGPPEISGKPTGG